jgi:hypothetical protein
MDKLLTTAIILISLISVIINFSALTLIALILSFTITVNQRVYLFLIINIIISTLFAMSLKYKNFEQYITVIILILLLLSNPVF